MAYFRKKPVVIEALPFDGTVDCAQHIARVFGRDDLRVILNGQHVNGGRLSVPTLEGDMTASPGDWIIKGVNGEVYPCKPDIFEKTYEPLGLPTVRNPSFHTIGDDSWAGGLEVIFLVIVIAFAVLCILAVAP